VKHLATAAACAAALGLASPAAAAITVETFLAKIAGLKKKGPLALFSGDIGVLKRESMAPSPAWNPTRGPVRPQVARSSSAPPSALG
jgi:hypothetical protein